MNTNTESNVYFALDEESNALKIGKADDVDDRLSTLQTGNPNPLIILYTIKCRSDWHALDLEKKLHERFDALHIRGEWFKYDLKLFQQCFKETFNFEPKQKREPLINSTLWGEEIIFDVKKHPRCYFYKHHVAQILDSYENCQKKTIAFRTMEWDTDGKMELLPHSKEINRVFISTRKHNENMKQIRFEKAKQLKLNEKITANTIENFVTL